MITTHLNLISICMHDGMMDLFQYFRSVDGQYLKAKLLDPQRVFTQEVPLHAYLLLICTEAAASVLRDLGCI